MRRILVGYDGTRAAERALRDAVVLAERDDSWLVVLTAVPLRVDRIGMLTTASRAPAIAAVATVLEGEAVELQRRALDAVPGLEARTSAEVVWGTPCRTLANRAVMDAADLVVIGESGETRAGRGLGWRLHRRTGIPVLRVRADGKAALIASAPRTAGKGSVRPRWRA